MKLIKILVFFMLVYSVQAQRNINSYEFWLDNNFNQKTIVQVSPTSQLELDTEIDISNADNGFHIFSIRFIDQDNNSSSVFSKLIYKIGNGNEVENQITEIQFWIDDFESKRSIVLESSSEIILDDELDLSSFQNGFHIISLRFKDEGGSWSSVYSQMIFKMGNSEESTNKITSYRYWYNQEFENVVYVELDKPIESTDLNLILEIPSEETDAFNIQFLDVSNNWSSVYTRFFTPEANFQIFSDVNTFSFMNTSTFATSYRWNFGDGSSEVTTTHPTHDYNTPGVYTVKLIAENKLGIDTAYNVVNVNGLREVVSNKAGNGGLATIKVYGGGLLDGSKFWIEKNGEIISEGNNVRLARLDALEAQFDLFNKEVGFYDVAVELPNGTVWKLENSFQIEAAILPEPFVNFNGRDKILFSRWQTYTIDFGNKGNTDALGVPIYFMVTNPDLLEIEFKNLNMVMSEHAKDNEHYEELSTEPFYIEHQGFFDGNEKVRLYAFYVPIIPANSTGQVQLRIRTNDSFKAYTWLNAPMFEYQAGGIVHKGDDEFLEAMDKKTAACIRAVMFQAMKDGIADIVNNLVPGIGCANSILNYTMDPAGYLAPDPTNPDYNKPKSWSETFWNWGGQVKDVTLLIAGCATDIAGEALPLKKAYQTAIAVISVANNIYGGVQAARECYKKYGNGKKDVSAVSSFDPNEIIGPSGYGYENYLNSQNFAYTIFFENKENATAPAQEVIILDTLDAEKFNFSTFSFGQFSFGGLTYTPLEGRTEFTIDIPIEGGNKNIVRVNGKFNPENGVIYWQFITLDPNTMDLTEDPEGGFLPPNIVSPQGEGSVSFFIQINDKLNNNQKVSSKALIFFDLNAPIETNTYSNSLDYSAPESIITGIYYTNEENIYRITIDGADNESGIKHFIIYASEDNAEYLPISSISENYFFFTAEEGKEYRFYSVAEDNVGNVEDYPNGYDVSTLNVSVTQQLKSAISIYPNPADGFVNISFNLNESAEVTIDFYNSMGIMQSTLLENYALTEGFHFQKFDCSNFTPGVYIVRLRYLDQIQIKKFVVN